MSKKPKKDETIYCAFCGAKNSNTDTNCIKCNKVLHPKNEPFKDFLYKHIKDDLKGKVQDSIFSYLKNFIISHLYGAGMTVAVIFTAVAIIVSPKSNYKVVSSASEILQSNSKGIVATFYTYDDSCEGTFPKELADVPFPMAGYVVSGNRITATTITLDKGQSLTDWCNNGHTEELVCTDKVYLYDEKVKAKAQDYRDKFYAYADWYHTNGITDDEEYARRADEVDYAAFELMYGDYLTEYDKTKPVKKSIELFVSEIGCVYKEGNNEVS